MFDKSLKPTQLQIRRLFNVSRQKIFTAWTEPDLLMRWFHPVEGYTLPLAQVDLRIGGAYRLGMQPPGGEEIIYVRGEYREIEPPEKLVFTWAWESDDPEPEETLVTVEFFDRGGKTEVVLTHQRFPNPEVRDQHVAGWEGCLAGLVALFEP